MAKIDVKTKVISLKPHLDYDVAEEMVESRKVKLFQTLLHKPKKSEIHLIIRPKPHNMNTINCLIHHVDKHVDSRKYLGIKICSPDWKPFNYSPVFSNNSCRIRWRFFIYIPTRINVITLLSTPHPSLGAALRRVESKVLAAPRPAPPPWPPLGHFLRLHFCWFYIWFTVTT